MRTGGTIQQPCIGTSHTSYLMVHTQVLICNDQLLDVHPGSEALPGQLVDHALHPAQAQPLSPFAAQVQLQGGGRLLSQQQQQEGQAAVSFCVRHRSCRLVL